MGALTRLRLELVGDDATADTATSPSELMDARRARSAYCTHAHRCTVTSAASTADEDKIGTIGHDCEKVSLTGVHKDRTHRQHSARPRVLVSVLVILVQLAAPDLYLQGQDAKAAGYKPHTTTQTEVLTQRTL